MDGVTQANYILSYMADVGAPRQQPWPAREKDPANVTSGARTGVGAVGTQYPEVGTDGRPASEGLPLPGSAGAGLRPEDVGAKVISSVDGDTVTISAEGQAYVQQTAAAVDAPDVASATAKVEDVGSAFGQPFGQPFGAVQTEPPAETFFDLPQGGGIERADFEQPEVQQIQNAAEEAQETERMTPQLLSQEEPASAVEAAPEEEAETGAEEKVEPSDFRQYFNSELRQMLYRGQITQQQYDDEMENRKTEDDLKIDKKVV